MIDTTEIDSRFGVPEHLEHLVTTPDGRSLAVAEWGIPERVVRCLASVSVAPADADGVEFVAGMNEGNIREFGAAVDGEAALRAWLEPERADMIEAMTSGNSDFMGADYEMPEADRIEMADDGTGHMGNDAEVERDLAWLAG